jgi:hypothetical protein
VRSRYVLVDHTAPPARGIVKAVGPGTYPKKYDHQDKHKRTKFVYSKHFLPTEVKVGDVVELGEGFAFEQFWWGDTLHIHCTEKDVCGIRDITEAQARAEARGLCAS